MKRFSWRLAAALCALSLAILGTTAVDIARPGPRAEADSFAGRDDAVGSQPVLLTNAALAGAQASLKAAVDGRHQVTVVVMDRTGTVRVLLRGDGAGPQTEESARRKAFTAVSFGQPTSALVDRVKDPGGSLRDIPGTLFLAGGVPVAIDGQPIAAIGVGGAPSGDIDEAYARAGVDAIMGIVSGQVIPRAR
jgi:uncharacterized protein GlcG (DUF336 family)